MGVSRRSRAALALCAISAALVVVPAGSAATAAPAPPPSPLLNPALYPGTLRPSSSCADPKSCTSFRITFTNTDKVQLNSFMIEIKGNPFVSFELDGQPACQSTAGSFGPGFENDWLCLGLNVPPGGTFTGGGVATQPLTAATTARFDESNQGSISGLLPDYSQDIHYYPVAAGATKPKPKKAKPHLTQAEREVQEAASIEEEALKLPTSATIMSGLHREADSSLAYLTRAGAELTAAVGDDEIDRATEARITDDLFAAEKNDRAVFHDVDEEDAKDSLTKAIAKKKAALRLIEAALKQ